MSESNYRTDFSIILGSWSARQALKFLNRTPSMGIIIRREHEDDVYWYVRSSSEVRTQLQSYPDATVSQALNLHEYQAADIVSPTDSITSTNCVIIDGEIVTGYYMPEEKDLGPMRSGDDNESFSAYPAIISQDRVAAKTSFKVAIGFSDTEDSTLSSSKGKIVIEHAAPDAECQIFVTGEGLTLDRMLDTLPLKADALKQFKATPTIEQGIAKIMVQYIYFGQPIGYAERSIVVGKGGVPQPEPTSGMQKVAFSAMVDVSASVSYDEILGEFKWLIWSDPSSPVHEWEASEKLAAGKTQQFAKDLLRDLKKENFSGVFAERSLRDVGEKIAALMPPKLWELLKTKASNKQTAPTLLLYTNEAYIPWELAVLPKDPLLDSAKLPYLAVQTSMGRWLKQNGIVASPPTALSIDTLSVIFSEYGLGSGQNQLKEAGAEAQYLVDTWQAQQFDAKKTELMPLLTSKPAADGHLLHFAVHGVSDVQGNAQSLILADKTELLPAFIMDDTLSSRGDPRFVFIFINACQVGTAGESLGQVAGFPGTLLRKKVSGFLAPLWEAHDVEARQFAERLYTNTLKDGQSVGEALHTLRGGYDPQTSTTPIAYIYYGHPSLKLKRG